MNREPTTIWNRNYVMILIFGFLSGTAGQMVGPLLSRYSMSLGASLEFAASLVGLISGVSFFARPFAGGLIDMLNRKYVMMVSLLFYLLAYAGYRFFPYLPALVISRLLQGIGASTLGIARIALATEFTPKDRMGEGVALNSFGIVLSQVLGPGFGLWIADHWGYRACFNVALVCSIIGMGLIAMIPYRYQPSTTERKRLNLRKLVEPKAIPYGVLGGILYLLTYMANSFIALLGDERGIPNVAWFFSVYAILAIFLRPISGKLLDRYGLSRQLYPAFIFASLFYVLLANAYSLPLILLAAVCKTLSQGIALPSMQGTLIKRLGREHAGVATATFSFVQDAFCWLGPTAAGFLADNMGYKPMFHIFAAFTLVGIPIYIIIQRWEKKHLPAAETRR